MKQEAEAGREVELKIRASLTDDSVLVFSPEGIDGLSSRGYGVSENGKLVLTFCEALFLLSKGIVEIEDEKTGKEVSFQDVLGRFQKVDENAWLKYLIYRDLRGRGYVAREGFGLGIDFRVYERGEYGKETAKYLIFGMQEGQPISMEELARALKYVQSLKKKLVLAVVNRRGEVVYYSLSQLTLK
ncbi:MAG: tRNA-splicing endonuclease [Candidatus Bathyarchaeota archaeon BA1]|nr:MAG: tRNA-splicing endonuclease [Candidatus Bathyarchaeota archaeon BA1]